MEVHFRAVEVARFRGARVARFRGAWVVRFRGAWVVRSLGAVALAQPPVVADDSPAKGARLPDEMNSAHETPALADDR